jgi:hypothetical protein
MPRYDYECPQGHRFEQHARMSACDTPVPCTTEGCTEQAVTIITGGHLDHGIACHRDASLAGNWDGEVISRHMSSGRAAGRNR